MRERLLVAAPPVVRDGQDKPVVKGPKQVLPVVVRDEGRAPKTP